MNTNEIYMGLIRDCISCGDEVSPRGQLSHELIQNNEAFNMESPIITIEERGLDYQFMAAEAYWILTGQRHLDEFVKKNLIKYSDDGETMYGAYGPPFVAQVDGVVSKLLADPDTRQAVISIWRPNPDNSKDIPCTVGMQFLLRNGRIHTNVWMRSQDVWLGLPYDLFTFTMMTAMIRARINSHLEEMHPKYTLGFINITAGSRHLYNRHVEVSQDLSATWHHSSDHGEKLVLDYTKINNPDSLLLALDISRRALAHNYVDTLRSQLCLQ